MVDPVTASALRRVADSVEESTGGLLTRLFGPSADLLGEQLRDALANRFSNTRKVIDLAEMRTSRNGTISLRVADGVLNAAQYADSAFVAEYLSGILASSRTADGRDDNGVAWTSLIAQLSSDQIGLHYVLYAAARPIIVKHSKRQTDSSMCTVRSLISFKQLNTAMSWATEQESPRFREAVYGLQRQGLLGTISHGTEAFLKRAYPSIDIQPSGGLIYRVRIPGLMMYLWGLGCGGEPATALLESDFDVAPIGVDLPKVPHASFAGFTENGT